MLPNTASGETQAFNKRKSKQPVKRPPIQFETEDNVEDVSYVKSELRDGELEPRLSSSPQLKKQRNDSHALAFEFFPKNSGYADLDAFDDSFRHHPRSPTFNSINSDGFDAEDEVKVNGSLLRRMIHLLARSFLAAQCYNVQMKM